ncbi:MAG: diguanylate cyclase [Candidatus Riflebacteria bacterium]|nr:diguanylate cyclase [Candidatus Riflebacteria bacterium]
MEFFRNAGIAKRIVISTLLVLALPIVIFLYVNWMGREVNFKVLFFLSNIFFFVGLASSWFIALSITRPIDRIRAKLAVFIEKRIPQSINDSAEDELSELSQDFNRLFSLWNNELGAIVRKQRARGEETVKIAAAQSQIEAQLMLTRSCLQVAQRLNVSFDFQSNLKTILDEGVKTLNVQWASILLINRESLEMTVACVRGVEQSLLDDLAEDQYPSIKLKPTEGLAGLVIKEGVPIIANKGFRDPRFKTFSEFPSRSEKIASILCAPIKTSDGTVLGVMNFQNRINPPLFRNEDLPYTLDLCTLAALVVERNRLYQHLFTDETTGLLSHRVWRSYVQEEAARAARYSQPLAIVILDIDRYQSLIETSSAEFAMKVSSDIGATVQKALRDTDVGSRAKDRYYVMLPNTDAAGAIYFVGRVKESVEKQSFEYNGSPLGITLSAGVASFPESGPDPRNLIVNARTALDQAKSDGRNRAAVFGSQIESPLNKLSPE